MHILKLIYEGETGLHHAVPHDEIEYHSFEIDYEGSDHNLISRCDCGAVLKNILPDGQAFFHNPMSEGAIDAVNQILTP